MPDTSPHSLSEVNMQLILPRNIVQTPRRGVVLATCILDIKKEIAERHCLVVHHIKLILLREIMVLDDLVDSTMNRAEY